MTYTVSKEIETIRIKNCITIVDICTVLAVQKSGFCKQVVCILNLVLIYFLFLLLHLLFVIFYCYAHTLCIALYGTMISNYFIIIITSLFKGKRVKIQMLEEWKTRFSVFCIFINVFVFIVKHNNWGIVLGMIILKNIFND